VFFSGDIDGFQGLDQGERRGNDFFDLIDENASKFGKIKMDGRVISKTANSGGGLEFLQNSNKKKGGSSNGIASG